MSGYLTGQIRTLCFKGIAFGILFPLNVYAEELSFFKFTDVSGSLALRYLYNEHTLDISNLTNSHTQEPTYQEELSIDTEGYIYHPNLLTLSLGGGFLYDQSRYESMQGSSESSEQLENLYMHLDFLNKKPYPVSLYYDQSNPSIMNGLSGHYIQENTRSGINASLLEPFSPVQINVNAYHDTANGEGSDQIVDETRDYCQIQLYHSYGSKNTFQLTHTTNQLDSQSGNPNLSIEHRLFTIESSNLVTRNSFGDSNQIDLINTIGYVTQDAFPIREEFTFSPNLNWRLTDSLSTFYRFNLFKSDEDVQSTTNQKLTIGVNHATDAISSGMNIHGDSNQTDGMESNNTGVQYFVNYNKPYNNSEYSLSYAGSYDAYDQETTVSQIQIFNEEHILSGVTSVTLLHQFVDVTSIVVTNTSHTQTFVEDVDFRIILIGSSIYIQRLISGNILDGQTVLINYSFNTGGIYAYDILTQKLGINVSFYRYYQVYSQYLYQKQELTDGNPTLPLNSVSRKSIGFSADRPLPNGMTVGGELSYVSNDEDISPSIENNIDAFIELSLPRLTDLRLSAHHQGVDYKYSNEDIYLTGYGIRINSQPWLRTSMVFESNFDRDSGGSVNRSWSQHRLQFGWRIRQLTVDLTTKYTSDEQGNTERDHWSIMFVAKRLF